MTIIEFLLARSCDMMRSGRGRITKTPALAATSPGHGPAE